MRASDRVTLGYRLSRIADELRDVALELEQDGARGHAARFKKMADLVSTFASFLRINEAYPPELTPAATPFSLPDNVFRLKDRS